MGRGGQIFVILLVAAVLAIAALWVLAPWRLGPLGNIWRLMGEPAPGARLIGMLVFVGVVFVLSLRALRSGP